MGILGDIARRDLSGGIRKEKTIRPQSLIDLREIINEEINTQGKNVDLRHIVIPPNVDALKCLFFGRSQVESLDLTGWDTSNIKSFDNMFGGCKNLKMIKGMENWDVSNVFNFYEMFDECESLETIDVSGWHISFNNPYLDMLGMFRKCENLKMIKGFDKLNVSIDVLLDIKQCCPNIILKPGEVKM